nr:MAG TPA: hypothetical protein [Caudoviricetes sp.]
MPFYQLLTANLFLYVSYNFSLNAKKSSRTCSFVVMQAVKVLYFYFKRNN